MAKSKKPPLVIEMNAVTKVYGQDDSSHVALDQLDLKIEKGEFVAIMGPSGCGKTTLLNLLGLLDSASEGKYKLNNRVVSKLSHAKRSHIRAHQIGFVFQSFNLLPRLNILENVALPLSYQRTWRHKNLAAASKILKTFELETREYYMPDQLSGGQLQRVAIARALVNNPSIILADEPTGNLDSKSSELIMNELRDIHLKGNTIVMVTHNPDLTTYASRVIIMGDGKIMFDSKHPEAEVEKSTKQPLDSHLREIKEKLLTHA
ncbi:MAG TPA: ABC transporter ATP-binding protein [Candidatus Saccharimonadales bacterium]|nr:ABC transporter ATP-binding protein [Candidatus Saccharimonadales bacterium]